MKNWNFSAKRTRYISFVIIAFYAIFSLGAIYIPNGNDLYSILSIAAVVIYLILTTVKLALSKSCFLAEIYFSIISFFAIFLVTYYHHQINISTPLNILAALGNCATAIGAFTIFWDFVSELSNAILEC